MSQSSHRPDSSPACMGLTTRRKVSHSHTLTLTLSHSHSLTLSHSHTLTLSHSHTLTLSRRKVTSRRAWASSHRVRHDTRLSRHDNLAERQSRTLQQGYA